MCEELDELLAQGNTLARWLVEHLQDMGASEGTIPIKANDDDYQVIVRSPEAILRDKKHTLEFEELKKTAKRFIDIWESGDCELSEFKEIYFSFLGLNSKEDTHV